MTKFLTGIDWNNFTTIGMRSSCVKCISELCRQASNPVHLFNQCGDFVDIEFYRTMLQLRDLVSGEERCQIVGLTELLLVQFAKSDRLAVLNQSLGGLGYEF